jgi:glycosyltransferase involved in cell wall biosynthesis
MFKGNVLYIGNKLGKNAMGTVTTLDVLSTQLEGEGFTVYSASAKRNKIHRMIDMLFAVIKYRNRVDVVLIDTYSTQNFHYAVAVADLCRLFRLPYIPILHGGNLPQRLQKSRSQASKLFKGAKTNVAPSKYLMDAFAAEGYHNLTYIPNTIEIEQYSYLPRNQTGPKLLWVRSFAEIYNPMLALLVVEKLREEFPNVSLCMTGPEKDGSLQRCKAYATDHQLPVIFTGMLSKEAWRERSEDYDIFINTTNFDNTPVSVMEAMALGLPVISTNVGGVPYLIEDQKDGLLVPSDDRDQFVNAIHKLCTNNELARSLSANARRKAEGFDWQNVKQHWLTLLRE